MSLAAAAAAPALALERVRVELSGTAIVEDVSLGVAAGEWLALIGPNGAGKSTLLRAIAGLAPYTGGVAVAGAPASGLSRRERARRIAFVPQTPLVPEAMRVADYVLLGRTPHVGWFGSERHDDVRAAERALRQLDLDHLADRRLGTLSGGERQRALLARAVAQEAPLLLLDEPTSALDVGRQQEALELVDALRRETGLTVVSAMHDLTLASRFADSVVLLARGVVVAAGAPREVVTDALIGAHYGASVRVVDAGDALAVVPLRRV